MIDLLSLGTLDLEKLKWYSPSEEILKLEPYQIGLIGIFKEFVGSQKLGLRSEYQSITFKEFSEFWSKQYSSKRRLFELSIATLSHSTSSHLIVNNLSFSKLDSNLK